MERQARLTSKGQITVPREIRRWLGVRTGDKLVFESDEKGIRVRALRRRSVFFKYCGLGNEGALAGRKNIKDWLRRMRGR